MTNQLYCWRSKAQKEVGDGYLIAVAPSPDEARIIIKSKARDYFIRFRFEFSLHYYNRFRPDGTLDGFVDTLDNDEKEEIEGFVSAVAADLAAEPETSAALFIRGSE